MKRLALVLALLATGCQVGDVSEFENHASRTEIISAAERCGLQDFEPTRMGDGWGAEVSEAAPNFSDLEDCIYRELAERGLVATRMQ